MKVFSAFLRAVPMSKVGSALSQPALDLVTGADIAQLTVFRGRRMMPPQRKEVHGGQDH